MTTISRRGLIAGAAVLGMPYAAGAAGRLIREAGTTADPVEVIALGHRDFTHPLIEGSRSILGDRTDGAGGYRIAPALTGGSGETLFGRSPVARTVLLFGSDADLLLAGEMVRDARGAILAMAHESAGGSDPARLRLAGERLARRAAGVATEDGSPVGPAFMILRLPAMAI